MDDRRIIHITSVYVPEPDDEINGRIEGYGINGGYGVTFQMGEFGGNIRYSTQEERNLNNLKLQRGRVTIDSKVDQYVDVQETDITTDDGDIFGCVLLCRNIHWDADVEQDFAINFPVESALRNFQITAWFRLSTRKIVWWGEYPPDRRSMRLDAAKPIHSDKFVSDSDLISGSRQLYRSHQPTPEYEERARNAIDAFSFVAQKAIEIHSMWKEGKIRELMMLKDI